MQVRIYGFNGLGLVESSIHSIPAHIKSLLHSFYSTMIVYRDIISGDEILSDAYKLEEVIDAEGNKVRRFRNEPT